MMLDEKSALFRAHRNNIHRYRRLLETKLSSLEHQFIEKRLAEEESALVDLTAPCAVRVASSDPLSAVSHPCSAAESSVGLQTAVLGSLSPMICKVLVNAR
ncbi:hypothetical protein [Bradyrhizobium sp. WSM2254]|uniref:hypothetical protein n=1 Tax=Bradyrhizobium sp. WSM2254 TaxID=1188263 RepID=UPI000676247F|nr:hypothetical protein [Bradyrhizobium sp. WSM2254]